MVPLTKTKKDQFSPSARTSLKEKPHEFTVFGPDIETTGLNPYQHKMITIQLRIESHNYIWAEWKDGGEKGIISKFLEFWDGIPRKKAMGGATFVGYNMLHFDIPFITERAKMLRIEDQERIWDILVHYPVYLDLYQLLGDSLMSFARWKGLLVGSASKLSGADIPELYRREDYDAITNYVEDELESLERIYNAVKKEPFYTKLMELRRQADSRG